MSPYQPVRARPNRWAFAITLPLGVLMVVVLAAIQIPRSNEPASFVLGQAFSWAMLPAVGIGLLVFFLPTRVPWWLYAPGVIVGAALLFAIGTVGPNADPESSGRTDERPASSSFTPDTVTFEEAAEITREFRNDVEVPQ